MNLFCIVWNRRSIMGMVQWGLALRSPVPLFALLSSKLVALCFKKGVPPVLHMTHVQCFPTSLFIFIHAPDAWHVHMALGVCQDSTVDLKRGLLTRPKRHSYYSSWACLLENQRWNFTQLQEQDCALSLIKTLEQCPVWCRPSWVVSWHQRTDLTHLVCEWEYCQLFLLYPVPPRQLPYLCNVIY